MNRYIDIVDDVFRKEVSPGLNADCKKIVNYVLNSNQRRFTMHDLIEVTGNSATVVSLLPFLMGATIQLLDIELVMHEGNGEEYTLSKAVASSILKGMDYFPHPATGKMVHSNLYKNKTYLYFVKTEPETPSL